MYININPFKSAPKRPLPLPYTNDLYLLRAK